MATESDVTGCCGMKERAALILYTRMLFAAGALLCLLSVMGCAAGSSASESSGSISTSFESSFKSSKSSSAERKEAYQGDVKHYTEVYIRSNSDVARFTRGLSSISEQYGTTNWEADHSTYVGIGEGLATAGVTQRQVDLYLAHLAKGDPLKIAAIEKGLGR